MLRLIKANGSVPNCFLPIGFKFFFNSCTCRPYLCHIYENISSAKWHSKEERKKTWKLVQSLGYITSNSRVWVFRDSTFDHKATNNILVLAIAPKTYNHQKQFRVHQETQIVTQNLEKKNIKMWKRNKTCLNPKPYFGLHPPPRGQVMQWPFRSCPLGFLSFPWIFAWIENLQP